MIKEEQLSCIEALVAKKDVCGPLERSFGNIIINALSTSFMHQCLGPKRLTTTANSLLFCFVVVVVVVLLQFYDYC